MFGSIKLKFIGENGSMGLVYGRVYHVQLLTDNKYLWVRWTARHPRLISGESIMACPYISVQAFANNWALPD